ncbi:MAG: hypothetical protein ACI4F1_01380 [Bariatricus sp.]
MSIEQRVRMCLLIERINEQKDYSKALGLEEKSKFHGKRIVDEEDEGRC